MADLETIQLLTEIRDLLRILAAPLLAEIDREGRQKIAALAGKSAKRRAAVLAMDGKRTRADIQKQVGIDQGDFSRFVADLKAGDLLDENNRVPRLKVSVAPDMFK